MTVRHAATMGTVGSTWQARGYCGAGPTGDLIGSLAGRSAIICGGAAGVFADFERARQSVADPVVFAVNDVGMYLPTLDHWVSLHAEKVGLWTQLRHMNHHAEAQTPMHSVRAGPFVDHVWTGLTPLFVLSGYVAMQLAWVMGCERIILCGCPGDATPRFFEASRPDGFGYGAGAVGSDQEARRQVEAEMTRVPELKQAVRSMSGWTREFFGGLEGA